MAFNRPALSIRLLLLYITGVRCGWWWWWWCRSCLVKLILPREKYLHFTAVERGMIAALHWVIRSNCLCRLCGLLWTITKTNAKPQQLLLISNCCGPGIIYVPGICLLFFFSFSPPADG